MKLKLPKWDDVLVIVLTLGLIYVSAVAIVVTFRISAVEQQVQAQVKADHAAIQRHAQLLKRVEADEVRLCLAAKSTGNQTIIKILCPASGGPP